MSREDSNLVYIYFACVFVEVDERERQFSGNCHEIYVLHYFENIAATTIQLPTATLRCCCFCSQIKQKENVEECN